LHTGCYVMGAAEHREPCESRGSRTVLGAPGGETPPGDSTNPGVGRCAWRRIKYLRKLTKLLQRIRSVRTARITMTPDPAEHQTRNFDPRRPSGLNAALFTGPVPRVLSTNPLSPAGKKIFFPEAHDEPGS